ncbi:type II secretion system protein F [Clostridium acetireducens DSM 10703]|uniref:Type II secretion system protein F n=1 Tax=Clostridium acetireducens DSM 10703 TaxID=1121290 RepID=A0A1E8F1S8_9CLOT|nr:type II secretion system F family protein [Clostridium acetireducens]OFI07575.1 type II secretion system protein F [Clostridium acetireducens DSM 10703]
MSKIYKYKAKNLKGEILKGCIHCENEKELLFLIKQKGYFCLQSSKLIKFNIDIRKPNKKDIFIMCRQFYIILSSGLSIWKALDIISIKCKNKYIKYSLKNIKEDIIKGYKFYNSIKKFDYIYPEFLIEMIGIGEESGNIEKIFKDLSEYYENMYKIELKFKNSMIYPSIVCFVSIFVIAFLMIKILPQFVDILSTLGGNLPKSTYRLMCIFEFIKGKLFLLTFILILIIMFFKFLRKNKDLKTFTILDNFKLKIPLIKNLYKKIVLLKFSKSMNLLIKSGFSIIKSLYISSNIVNNVYISDSIKNAIYNIEKGFSLSDALKSTNIFDDLFVSMIIVGEESGKLEEIFLNVSFIYENDIKENLKILSSFIEPVLIIILSVIIGTITISLIMPILNIMDCI